MNARVLMAYMRDCKQYGWTPSLIGLRAYAVKSYLELRTLWMEIGR